MIATISKVALAAVCLAAVSTSVVSSVSAGLSSSEQSLIVQLHNAARDSVSPSAADMQPMSWDASLASHAESYAAKCVTVHSHTPGMGENLAWGWPSMALDAGVGLWEDEKSIFVYSGSDIGCGHYTQMIWSKSNRVGCAKQSCANLSGKGPGDVIVCNYAEPGNYLNSAGKIGSPYQAGTSSTPAPQAQVKSTESNTDKPKEAAPVDSFHWVGGSDAFSQCSASCGQGDQTRKVYCANQNNQGVDSDKCDQSSKPSSQQQCNVASCPAPAPAPTAAPQQETAASTAAPEPKKEAEVTYSWSTGDYSVCSATCAGEQTRTVECKSSKGDVSADGACKDDKPKSSVKCNGECPEPQSTAAPAPAPAPSTAAPVPTPSTAAPAPSTAAPEVVEEVKSNLASTSAPMPVAPEPVKSMSISDVAQQKASQCANATVIEDFEALFNSTDALNSTGLLRSALDVDSPSSLNCSAIYYYLESASLLNCTLLVNSSAINSTGGAPDAQYTLGDCIDSWFNTSFASFFNGEDEHEQTHFGNKNFTSAQFDSDYKNETETETETSTLLLESPLPSSTDESAQAKAESLQRNSKAQQLAAQSSATHIESHSASTLVVLASAALSLALLF